MGLPGQTGLSSWELSHRWTLDGALWSDARSGALGGAREEDKGRNVQAGAMGSGPMDARFCH